MGRVVYAGGKQFDSVSSLKEALRHAWDGLSAEDCQNLIRSMATPCIKVVEKDVGYTGY